LEGLVGYTFHWNWPQFC